MEPQFPVGTLILSDRVDIESVEVSDVICFRSKSSNMLGKIITHRVVGKSVNENKEVQLLTKGDANLAVDGSYVTAENFVGRVIWSSGESSLISNLISFFTSEIGFMVCIAIPCLLISGSILRDCVSNIKGDMKKIMEDMAEQEGKRIKSSEQDPDGKAPAGEESKTHLDTAEYEALRAKIRAELIEEMAQRGNPEQSEKQ